MFTGSCHCGKVNWAYPLQLESVTACNCTLCRRYGALWVYGYLEDGITVSGKTKYYERDSKHNGFHFCENCGVVVYYLAHKRDEQGRLRIAINLRTSDDPKKIMDLPIDHFDGLDTFEDLPRDGCNVEHLWF